MHSYREAFEDSKADRVTHSPTYGGGGENFPQTPRLPMTPQTLHFTTCRSALSKSLNSLVFAFFLFSLLCTNQEQTKGTEMSNEFGGLQQI